MPVQPDTLAAAPAAAPTPPPDSVAGEPVDSLAESVADAIVDAVPALGQATRPLEAVNRVLADTLAAPVEVPVETLKPDDGAVPVLWARLVDALHDVTGLGTTIVSNLLLTLVVVGVLWGLRQLVLAVVRRRSPEARSLYSWRKTSTYVAVFVGLVLVVRIWVGALGAFGTFLGLLTAGVAIALRDPLVNLAGWGFILWKRPFAPGDRVTIRQHTGDVIDQRLFQFTLLEVGTATGAEQSTGRIVHVPNGWVFSDSVVNYTGAFAYVWHEIAVVVTFESDWREAKRLLTDIAHRCAETLSPDAERRIREAARDYYIFYSKLTPVVYTSVVEHGVRLTLRFLVAPRRIRGSEETVWEAILDAFSGRDDLTLAFPTSRLFRADEEGRLGGPVLGGLPGAAAGRPPAAPGVPSPDVPAPDAPGLDA